MSPPDTHEKSLERSWQTVQKRMKVVEQSLIYVLPLGLQNSLLEHVCELLNSYDNLQFSYSSPHIILNGTHNGYNKFPGHLPISFGSIVQSRESDIVPQTGIVVGITGNSAGSQKVYFPSFNGQKGATILQRKASELTVIHTYPSEWKLVSQVIPIRGPVTVSCIPTFVSPPSVSQPILNPILLPPILPSLIPSSIPIPSRLHPPSSPPLVPIPLPPPFLSPPILPPILLSPLPLLPSSSISSPVHPSTIHLPPPPISSLPVGTSFIPCANIPDSASSTFPPSITPIIPSPVLLPTIPIVPPLTPISPTNSPLLIIPPTRHSTRTTKTPLRFLVATSPLPSSVSLKPAAIRRNALARQATAKKSQYLIDTSQSRSTNNRYIPVTLLPPQHKSSEISNTQAMQLTGPVAEKISQSCASEMNKCMVKYSTMAVIRECDIEADAIRVNSQMLYKPKPTDEDPDEWKARLAACGNRIPDDLKGETYAGTADSRNTALILAAFGVDAVKNSTLVTLQISNFDLLSAFLQNRLPRSATGGKQVVMKLQHNLPHPLAGKWVEVLGALYGLSWSNNIFWQNFDITMAKAQFYPIQIPSEPCLSTPIDNHIYSRFDPEDPNKKMVVPVTVDDGLMVGQNSLQFETGALTGAINTTRAGGTGAFKDLQAIREIAHERFNYKF